MPPLAVVVTTHTDRHLLRVLRGVGSQTRQPDAVVVTCDTADNAIAAVVEQAARELGRELVLVQREFCGTARSGQVRNNGARALLRMGMGDRSRVVFLDGDCCPAGDALAWHERLGRPRMGRRGGKRGRLVVGFRIDLTPDQTEAFDDAALGRGVAPVLVTNEQREPLRLRHKRYRWQARLRRLGIGKEHKPKVLSANFSVTLADFVRLNGFDESYEGYGQEDDDFGRRAYAIGVRPAVGVARAIVYHQWHPTRAPGEWRASRNAPRLEQEAPVRCVLGLDNPMPQPDPVILHVPPDRPRRPMLSIA